MRIYGLKVSIPDSKKVYQFFYTPLNFIDWKTYNPIDIRYDSSAIRYIFSAYLKEFTLNDESQDISEIYKLNVATQTRLIDDIFSKSMFGDDQRFRKTIDDSIRNSKTLDGCYDFFLYQHLPLETYLGMLEQDAETRAHVIGMLEQHRDVNVAERFNFAVANNTPVDLTSNKEEFARKLKRHKKTGVWNNPVKQNGQAPDLPSDEKLPPNIANMIAASRAALKDSLTTGGQQNKKPAFDWRSDERNFTSPDNME